jgi:NADPH:quinone reductase-like Zn-dependent oxidoreductase
MSDVRQAAIQVAQRRGAQVFTTVDVAEGRRFLTDTYQIPDEHILSIKDSDLTVKILAMTGTGVDVIVSSLELESRQASWACIAPLGRLLELAADRFNPSTNRLPTKLLAKSVSLHSVCLDVVMGGSKPLMRKIMDGVAQLFKGDSATVRHALPSQSIFIPLHKLRLHSDLYWAERITARSWSRCDPRTRFQ